MLSRVADSVYWMNRYIERAENVARMLDVNLRLTLDLPAGSGEQWDPLVNITGDFDLFRARYGEASREDVIRFLTLDRDYPSSIRSCLSRARENARSVREVISSDMWEQINSFYLMVRDAEPSAVHDSPYDFLAQVKAASHLFIGITETTMSHGEAWHFCRMGRTLERADKTSRIVDVKYFILLPSAQDVGSPQDTMQWTAVLRSASAFEMYRKQRHVITPERVADFLLLDREFPRAVHYCLNAADYSLHAISKSPTGTFGNLAEQKLGQLRSELTYTQIDDIMQRGLHEFLDRLQASINRVGESIYDTFFK